MNISLTTIAAIGSAAGIPWVAGATALPAAIASSETLNTFLMQKKEEQLELSAPSWTRDAQSWQTVCSSIKYHLPKIMDTMATQLKQVQGLPTEAIVKQTLIQAIAQHLPIWEIPAQERRSIAVYVAPLIFTKATDILKPTLDQMQKDVQAEMVVKSLTCSARCNRRDSHPFPLLSQLHQRLPLFHPLRRSLNRR